MGFLNRRRRDHDEVNPDETPMHSSRPGGSHSEEADVLRDRGRAAEEAGDHATAHRLWEEAAELGDPKSMFNLSAAAHEAGDREGARRWLERAVATGDVEALVDLGNFLADTNDLATAERKWEEAAELGHTGAMVNLGVVADKAGDEDRAREWWLRAADFGNATAILNLGLLERRAGDFSAARVLFERAADLGESEAMFVLGWIADEEGDDEAALAFFARAAQLDHAWAMRNVGLAARAAGDEEEALAWIGRAAEAGSPLAMIDLAKVLLELEPPNRDEARVLLEKARDVGEPRALVELGNLFADEGDAETAEALWLEAVEDGLPEAMARLGMHLISMDKPEEGMQWLERAVEAGDEQAVYVLAGALGDSGEIARARELINATVDDDRAAFIGGKIAASYHDLDFALDLFLRCADGGYPGAMIEAGNILWGRGERDEAIAMYERAIEAGETQGHYNIGLVFEYDGDRETARQHYEAGAAVDDPSCVRALGVLCSYFEDPVGAKVHLTRAVELGDVEALVNLTTTLLELGEIDEAEACARNLIDIGRSEGSLVLGNILEQRGDHDAADELYRVAGELGNSIGAYNYANSLLRNGRQDEARDWYGRAAADGMPDAMNALGWIAEQGDHIPTALEWYARAAEHGHELAAENHAKLVGVTAAKTAEPLDFTGPPLRAAGIQIERVESPAAGAIAAGNIVKVHFTVDYPEGGEYAWCEVETVEGDVVSATVANMLQFGPLKQIPFGSHLRFPRTCVIECIESYPDVGDRPGSGRTDGLENMEFIGAEGEQLGTYSAFAEAFAAGKPIPVGALGAISREAGDAIAAGAAGLMLLGTGDTERALWQFEAAAAAGDRDALALHEVLTQVRDGEEERTDEEVWGTWLKENPGAFAEALTWLRRAAVEYMDDYAYSVGSLLRTSGDLTAAAVILEPAVAAGVEGCKWELAAVRGDQGDHETLIALHRELAAEGHDRSLVVCGIELAELGRRDEAADYMWEAVRRGVEDADTFGLHLGILEPDESDPEHLVRFGLLHHRFGNGDEALRLLSAGADMGEAECEFALSRVLEELGDHAEAVDLAIRSIQHGRVDSWAWLTSLALGDDDTEAAIEWMRRGIAAGDVTAAIHLAELLADLNRYDGAVATLLPVVESSDPDLATEAMIGLIHAYTLQDDFTEAMAWAERAAEAGDSRGHFWVAAFSEDVDDHERSWTHYAYAAALGHGGAMYRLSGLENEAGNAAEALVWTERAAGAGVPDAMCDLARHAEAAGDEALAVSRYRAAAEQGSAAALTELAIRLLEDDREAAVELLDQAVELGDPLAGRIRWGIAYDADDDEWEEILAIAVGLGDPPSMLSAAFFRFDDDPDHARDLVIRAAETGFPIETFYETATNEAEREKMREMGIPEPDNAE